MTNKRCGALMRNKTTADQHGGSMRADGVHTVYIKIHTRDLYTGSASMIQFTSAFVESESSK